MNFTYNINTRFQIQILLEALFVVRQLSKIPREKIKRRNKMGFLCEILPSTTCRPSNYSCIYIFISCPHSSVIRQMRKMKFPLVIPVLFLQFFMADLAMAERNLATDQAVLLELKARITFDPQNTISRNWSASTSVCNWVGVSCGSRHARVTSLDLLNMNLKGIIPPHIGNLSFLSILNLQNNSFHGHLPHQLGQLRRLKKLGLGNNDFDGTLPPSIGALAELRFLGFHLNRIAGDFPRSLCNLTKLEVMEARYNYLEGSIPLEVYKLSALKKLFLANNTLSGSIPVTLFDITSLKEIDFGSNELSGT